MAITILAGQHTSPNPAFEVLLHLLTSSYSKTFDRYYECGKFAETKEGTLAGGNGKVQAYTVPLPDDKRCLPVCRFLR